MLPATPLLALFAGPAALLGDSGKLSGIVKTRLSGPVFAGPTGLAGDQQADLRVHGGPEKALHLYPHDHYAAWSAEEAGLAALLAGLDNAFGENLRTLGLHEHNVCLGDIFQAGDATLQVSQGRLPCWKQGARLARPELVDRIFDTGRTGWYFRVLVPGWLRPGDLLTHLRRPCPEWTIDRLRRALYTPEGTPAEHAALAALPELAGSWREKAARLASARTRSNGGA